MLRSDDLKEFIPNITDTDLKYNRYVGLKKLTSAINTIPAGDWICFQDDGELHVTVQRYDGTGYIAHSDKDQNSMTDPVTSNIEIKLYQLILINIITKATLMDLCIL